jgi:hypothetical protein
MAELFAFGFIGLMTLVFGALTCREGLMRKAGK